MAGGTAGHSGSGDRRAGLASVAPASLYVAALLLVPFVLLVYESFTPNGGGALTLANYTRIATSRVYLDSIVGTLELGLLVTFLCLLVGYPVAYFIARSGSRFVPLATAVVVLPLFVSVVVRSFGWMVLLGKQGTINNALQGIGLVSAPAQLLYTAGAVTAGLVHILVPLMILPIASVLRNVEPALEEAAMSLGASRFKVLWTVVLPLSLPGVAAGCLLVLSHAIAAFVLPALIGSDRVKLMATMIQQQVMVAGDFPQGAALAVVLVVVTFALLALSQLAARRLRF